MFVIFSVSAVDTGTRMAANCNVKDFMMIFKKMKMTSGYRILCSQ
jgi:hypothetical protein